MNDVLQNELVALRHELHQNPEVSGEEKQTAKRIQQWLKTCQPTKIITDIGGHGLAAVYDSGKDGPTVLFRCELDALPIFEVGTPKWRSKVDGKGHLCGHDGHMSILAGLARKLDVAGPKFGRIILMFQPAEEDGAGARSVINDEKFKAINPDYSFALHNLPGLALGSVGIKSGPLNFASEGLRIDLTGKTSHASHPEDGVSPALAMAKLVEAMPQIPMALGLDETSALATVVYAKMGVQAFGVAPANACVMTTLRAIDDDVQAKLMAHAEQLAINEAERHGLAYKLSHGEKFASCNNDHDAADMIRKAANKSNCPLIELDRPYRWSEDFGLFGSVSKAALCVLGAGEDMPQLHNSDYDFPDALIPIGVTLFENIARDLCG